MKGIALLIGVILGAAALFGFGFMLGTHQTDKDLLSLVNQIKNTVPTIKELESPAPETTAGLVAYLETLKNVDYWMITQSHYYHSWGDNNWNPAIRSLRIEFKDGQSFNFDDKMPAQIAKLVQAVVEAEGAR